MHDEALVCLQDFNGHLLVERKLSEHTALAYQRDLSLLVEFCDNKSLTGWAAVDHGHVQALMAQRHRQGASAASLQRFLSSIRSFYRFLRSRGIVKHDPTADVRAPRQQRKLPKALDTGQTERLLSAKGGGVEAIRDQAIMELFYSSGLRLAELIDLDERHYSEMQGGELKVRGKGDKDRIVPVGQYAIQAVQAWLKVRGELAKPGEVALFVGARGKRISRSTIQQRMKYWGRARRLRLGARRASSVPRYTGTARACKTLVRDSAVP